MVAETKLSLKCGTLVRPCPIPENGAGPNGLAFDALWILLKVFRAELLSVPLMVPCQLFVPLLVIMLTTDPELRPYSGPKLLVTIWYCSANSEFDKNTPGPPTELSLLF